ncbi:MAG: hypothetical protein M1834_007857 [Cirrosporium novae-zelandiae]|nr:MAG: hypothetical protein M1834_007857 [Cirrosporium novae-zelandiae]
MPPTTSTTTTTKPTPSTLKSALWLLIGRLVDEESINLNTNATPQFIGALTELVWMQIENVVGDVEMFARHAGRKTVAVEDVMLLARRNEGLEAVLRGFVDGVGDRE